MENKNTEATKILQQLGGPRFIVMTGAKNLMSDGNTLIMQVPAEPRAVASLRSRLTRVTHTPCGYSAASRFRYALRNSTPAWASTPKIYKRLLPI